jgi:hypothetical protein
MSVACVILPDYKKTHVGFGQRFPNPRTVCKAKAIRSRMIDVHDA